ncbi:MAG TPA: transglutaminase domain-containing protein [Gemmataceae bacterium]|nr:transglutaminase domain-containing protein [Gemmataceae bacterium]
MAFAPFVLGALLSAVGFFLGLIALRDSGKPQPATQPVVQAPAVQPQEPEPEPIDVPLPSSQTVLIEPGPGQADEEDIPVPVGKKKDRAVGEAVLPEIGPPVLKPPAPKADSPKPLPPSVEPPEHKATETAPVEPKRPDAKPAGPQPRQVLGKDAYAAIDAHALKAPPEAEVSLDELARYLASGARNGRERARAVYRWVTDRIAYDAEALFANQLPDPKPEFTLARRMGVCGGYANLFVDLCQRAGLEAETVGGYVKGLNHARGMSISRPDHAWSAVRFEDQWWLVDATWGAGSITGRQYKKEFTDYYFTTPPEQLIFTHLPEDESWQLRAVPLTLDEFVRRPKLGPDLFELGLTVEAVERAIADPGFREIVKTFRMPSQTTTAVRFPVTMHLKAGAEHQFEFKSDDLVSFAFVRDGKFIYFKRDKGVFRGTIRPSPGPLQVAAKPKGGGPAYAVILEYVVE